MAFELALLLKFTFDSTISLIHSKHAKPTKDRILPTPSLQSAQGNSLFGYLPSTFTTNINVVLLTFTVNPFDCHAHFQISSLLFRPSNESLMSSHQQISSGHFDLISRDSAPSTMINNKELKTVTRCNPTCNSKLLMKVPLTLTKLQPFLYIGYTIVTKYSSNPISSKSIIQHP